MNYIDLPKKRYDVVYADPPWPMYGSATKNAAAGKHYNLLSKSDLLAFPMRQLMSERALLFLWATCPTLDVAIDTLRGWGLHYRGVGFVWVKTNRAGAVMGARGIPPTTVKPITELVLVGSTERSGRAFTILDFKISQVVMAPVSRHSEKPDEVRFRIDRLCGPRSRIELFARRWVLGWDCWGDGLPTENGSHSV